MKYLAVLFLFCYSAVAQPLSYSDLAFLGESDVAVPANGPFIEFMTNLTTTANNAYHETPVFTPVSNALLIANMFIGTLASTIAVTNTGTTNLTWWPVTGQFISSVGNNKIFVTQLPIGTAPFQMAVGVTAANNPSGAEIHIWQVYGANTSALWGTNAIVQQTSTAGITDDTYEFVFTSPATGGSSLFVGVGHNTSVDSTFESTWVLGLHTGHTTPGHELDSVYKTNNVSGLTSMWSTNTGTRYFSFIEIKP